MDPLHPFVPIQAPPPEPPGYNRVERVDRDPQGDSGPEWERGSDDQSEEEGEQPLEDDYDPNWSDPAAAEPYGPDGIHHDAAVDPSTAGSAEWNPENSPERRARPRGARDDDEAQGAGPHIDISA